MQTLSAYEEPFDHGIGKAAGFSVHAGVAARADERQKLERLCRYISRPAIAEQRLPLTPGGNVSERLRSTLTAFNQASNVDSTPAFPVGIPLARRQPLWC